MGSLRVRRCLSANLPTEGALGEPIFTTDTAKLYFGRGAGQTLMEVKDGASLLANLIAGTGLSLVDNELDIIIDGITLGAANREVPAKPNSLNTDIYLPLNIDYNDVHGHIVTQYGNVEAVNGIILNGSQYITVNGFDFTADSWILHFKWKPDTTHTNQTLLSGTGAEGKFKLEYNPSTGGHANQLGLSLGDTGTFDIGTCWGDKNDFSSDNEYVVKILFNGTKYSLLVDDAEIGNISSTSKIYNSLTAINIGVNTDGLSFAYGEFDNFAYKAEAINFGTPVIETYLQIKNVPANLVGDGTISNTELSYLNGVTSNIQTQLDNIGLSQNVIEYVDQQDQALQAQITDLSTNKLDVTAFNTEVADIRADFATADTALQGQIDDITINTESVTNLNTRVSTIEAEIGNLSNTNSLPNLGTISKFSEENGILKFDNNDILTSNISTNINIFQPSNSPVTLSQNDEVTITHNTCTNGKMMISIFEEEPGVTGLTNIEQDFDLVDASKYTQEDSVTGTAFINGKVQLKAINSSDSQFNTTTEIPTMTSNTAPSGIASASSVASATYAAYKAVNGSNSSETDAWVCDVQANPISASNPIYWSYDFGVGVKKRIKKLTLTNRNYAISACPTSWVLQGSNDDSNWTNIYSVTNSAASLAPGASASYTFSNDTDYEYYRIKVTAANNTSGLYWDTATAPLVASNAGLMDVTQLSNGDLLAVGSTSNGVYKSTNNGASWSLLSTITGAGLVAILQLTNGDVLAVGTTTNRVYRSTDNGANWTTDVTIAGATLCGIAQLSNGDVIVNGYSSNKIYKYNSSTTTWDTTGVLVASGAGLDGNPVQLSNGTILIAGYTSGKIYSSTDNGANWSASSYTLVAGLQSLATLANGHVLCTVFSASYKGRVYRSTDNGASWDTYVIIDNTTYVSGVKQLSNKDVVVLGYTTNKIYTSKDSTFCAIGEIQMFEGIPLYTTIPKYITTSDLSQFNTSLVSKINSVTVTQTIPENTTIKALTSFDGRQTWHYYDVNSSSFVLCENGLSDIETLGNTLQFLASRFSNYSISEISSLNFAISLHTTDNTVSPSLDQITYNYDENTHFELATVGRYASSMEYGLKLIDANTSRIKKLSAGTSRIFVSVMI